MICDNCANFATSLGVVMNDVEADVREGFQLPLPIAARGGFTLGNLGH